jgi:hypothetical protein
MSDNGSGQHVRQSSRKQAGDLRVAGFTMMVRVPGQPAAVRVYADAEHDEPTRYAADGYRPSNRDARPQEGLGPVCLAASGREELSIPVDWGVSGDLRFG